MHGEAETVTGSIRKTQIWVILRFEPWFPTDDDDGGIASPKSYRNREEAEKEVARLNAISASKKSRYGLIMSRLIEEPESG